MAMRGHALRMATGEIPRTFSYPDERALAGDAPRAYPLNRGAGVVQMKAHASDDASDIVTAGLEALDMLHIGVAVTNAARQLLFANLTAKQILLTHDGLDVTAEGVLYSLDKCSGLSLIVYQAARAVQAGMPGPTSNLLTVRRSSGRRPLTLLVRSLNASLKQANLGGPAFLVFMWDPEQPVCDVEARLHQIFSLTSAEARLAKLLMEGKTLEECCGRLEIRISTARMHLGRVFAKTGVQRQGQLVSLLWKSVGMICTKRDESALQFAQIS